MEKQRLNWEILEVFRRAAQEVGIPPVQDFNRGNIHGVGYFDVNHLQLQCVYKLQGKTVETLNSQTRSPTGLAKIGLDFLFNRSGPLSMAPSQLGAFAYSQQDMYQKAVHSQQDRQDQAVVPSSMRPDLQYHVQPLSLERFGSPLHEFSAFTASVCHLRPTSRGSVHISGGSLRDPPIVNPNYLDTEEDKRVSAHAIQLTRKITSASSFSAYKPYEHYPGYHYQTLQELQTAAGHIGTTIFHPVGTLRMGRATDVGAVTDPELRVRGVQGLRVCDASVMPTITSGNTAAPTMMIAQKLADGLLGERHDGDMG